MPNNPRECFWCGRVFVTPSLARFCEDKHNDEEEEDNE